MMSAADDQGRTALDADEDRAWIALIRVVTLLPAVLDGPLQESAGLTHFEFTILKVLEGSPGRALRIGALARMGSSTLPRMSKAVSRLEARGLVRRFQSAGDGRAITVSLTDDGVATIDTVSPAHFAHVRQVVLRHMSREQLATLADALEPVVDAIVADG